MVLYLGELRGFRHFCDESQCIIHNAKCRIEISMNGNVIESKSFDFAVRIVNLHKHLSTEKKEFVLSKQLLRSGTSIGANVSEAIRGQSKADFAAKMCIALKEANESHYWIRLLYKTDFITEQEFNSIENDIIELIKILSSICKTSTQ